MNKFTVITVLLILISIPGFSSGDQEPAEKMEGAMMMEAADFSPIVEYRSMTQVMQLAEEKPTVLFFNASWCPSCKGAVRQFESSEDKLRDVNLVFVDYDNSDELQKKYGVSYQHTFVQVDAAGRSVVKWNGGGTDELLMKVKEM